MSGDCARRRSCLRWACEVVASCRDQCKLEESSDFARRVERGRKRPDSLLRCLLWSLMVRPPNRPTICNGNGIVTQDWNSGFRAGEIDQSSNAKLPRFIGLETAWGSHGSGAHERILR